mgnify:CR=1 FL=1
MNIHENTALLDAFVDGELTSDEMIQVQTHLDECPECRAFVDDALAIRAAFPTEEDLPLPADFAKNVMAAVAKTPQSRPKKQPWGKLAAAAACLAVIVLVQHGALGSTGSTDSASAYDTAAVMDVAAAESAPGERSIDAPSASAGSDDAADDGADTFTATSGDTLEAQKSKDPAAYTSGSGLDGTQMDETAASEDSAQENGAAVTVWPANHADLPIVHVRAADIGDLLDDRTPTEVEDSGVSRYLLTRQEYEDLAAELADRGVTLEEPDADSQQLWLEITAE